MTETVGSFERTKRTGDGESPASGKKAHEDHF